MGVLTVRVAGNAAGIAGALPRRRSKNAVAAAVDAAATA
jgi:hypothetical protein